MTTMITCSTLSEDLVAGVRSSDELADGAQPSLVPFGNLSILPPELRIQIWEDVLNSTGATATTKRTKRRICSYLRISKAIHKEMTSAVLYHQDLVFAISPDWPHKTFSSVEVRFRDPLKSWRAELQHSYYANCGFSKASRHRLRHFKRTPYSRFKSITIEVTAPNAAEPGELVLIYNHLMWVLRLLRRVPKLNVNFLESETRHWSSNGTLISSLSNKEPSWISRNNARPCLDIPSDLELLLFTIRQVELRPSVTVPAKIVASSSALSAYNCGRQCPAGHAHSEGRHARDWGMYLDLMLDALPGRVAEKLRLERCSTWSDDYVWTTWSNACHREPVESPVLITKDQKLPSKGIPSSLAFCSSFFEYESGRLWSEMCLFEEKTKLTSLWVGSLHMLCERLEYCQLHNPKLMRDGRPIYMSGLNGEEIQWSSSAWWDAYTEGEVNIIDADRGRYLKPLWEWKPYDIALETKEDRAFRRYAISKWNATWRETLKGRKLRL